MTDFQTAVVKAMGYNPDSLDTLAENRLVPVIEAAKEYLVGGGMPESFVTNLKSQAVTACMIGANDLLDGRAGQGNLSTSFRILANQLCSMTAEDEESGS